jgi:hypothetical protein
MNRTDKELVAIMVAMTGLFALGLYLGYDEGKTDRMCQHRIDKTPELIWNDDFESFPGEGDTIVIQKDDEDRIYLGPVE